MSKKNNNSNLCNIAIMINGAKPPRGGEYMTLNLVKNLDKDKFNLFLIYAEEGEIVKRVYDEEVTKIKISLNEKLTSIYLRETKMHSPTFLLSFLWNFIRTNAIYKAYKIIKDNDIKILYCADNLSKLIGGIAGIFIDVKIIAPCHDDFKEDMLGKVMRAVYVNFLDKILAVSDRVKSFFDINGKENDKVLTVYNGIDASTFDPERITSDVRNKLDINRDTFLVGSIGVLEKDKGHIYLLEAISKLKNDKIDHIAAIICGTGPDSDSLRIFVKDKGLSENVIFVDHSDEIAAVLKALDLFVMTSLSIESFSLVTVEAMAMKVPVIGTRVGALPEVIADGETGLLVSPANSSELADKIKRMIDSPEECIRMGIEGRKRVLEKFTIEHNVKQSEIVFLQALEGA